MDSTIIGALIGAGGTLVVFAGGYVTNSISSRGTARAAAQQQARTAVQELMRSALDVQLALTAWETRWRDNGMVAGTLGRAVAQLIDGYQGGHLYRGAASALGTAAEWRGASDSAQELILSGPISRMTAAAAQIAMLSDAGLREAANEVVQALGALMSAQSSKPKSSERRRAEKRVGDALARLGATGRRYDGKARP